MRHLPRLTFLCVLMAVASLPWLRLNLSSSVPRGLYRLHRVPTLLTYGQLVLVDVPEALRPWWPRTTPLLKPVAGVPGDVLTVQDEHFYINDQVYGLVVGMADGKPLPQVASPTVIPDGMVCLASRVPRSLDCRYTGPVAQATLKALATPFWTWEKDHAHGNVSQANRGHSGRLSAFTDPLGPAQTDAPKNLDCSTYMCATYMPETAHPEAAEGGTCASVSR